MFSDPEVQELSRNFDWLVIPVLNPDGYVFTFEKDRMWRKNTRPQGRCRGVDLNRNFDVNWNSVGSSNDSCQCNFGGSNAFSEPESSAMGNFLAEMKEICKIRAYFSLHSFSQLFMFPYGHTTQRVENYLDLKLIGEKAVEAIKQTHGKEYLTGSSIETIYPNSGSSVDYAYSQQIPIVFTIELRGARDSPNLFVLPAEEIIPTGKEALNAIKVCLNEARKIGYFQ